jgi:hypothetical protein
MSQRRAAELNAACTCRVLDHARLAAALEALDAPGSGFAAALQLSHPHLFADAQVYVAQSQLAQMAAVAAAVDRLVRLPAYRQAVLRWAPPVVAEYLAAHPEEGADGAFLGYDFHVGPNGPQLIEINTNAGGGLLNARLARASRACCLPPEEVPATPDAEAAFLAMFRAEWAAARGEQALTRIAIVDEAPATQFLAPEFELFRQLFAANGIAAVIADPSELQWDGTALQHASGPVDLVYNRLTDFDLSAPASAAIRAAWLAGGAVVTPHPLAHALYADKRNLTVLSDPEQLAALGADPADITTLAATVPRTVLVDATQEGAADHFWATRKQWFFKPVAGFGSRATYRGDKLTRRVFEEILAGSHSDYVAQALVPPAERLVCIESGEGQPQALKFDLRQYVYRGQVQLSVVRLYQGQTTNFRTPGGGFAVVVPVAATV